MTKYFRLFLVGLGCVVGPHAFAQKVSVPPELKATIFSNNERTPCVACLSASPDGAVFVGVDQIGSLGKGPGKGRIVKLKDTDQDGLADHDSIFATLDNPRGLMAVGHKVYVLHTVWKSAKEFEGMHLSVLTDANGDGIADGPPKRLVSNISCKKHNQSRGADHTTNGIRLGIDGWIYIAIGDFGMVDAKGSDGRTLTMFGGGIVRVRPDGTELETYVHGLRNIYDVSIDPFLNIFTRGNTNDGGGWNIRFIHEIQSGEYGYPILFKRYTSEIIPALADLGGGSGTGGMFFQEPGWPEKYNNLPLMCDWGKSQLYIHRVTPDGPTFTQEAEEYIRVGKITDVDVDGSGRLYCGSWEGSGFSGGKGGYVAQVVPQDWTYKPFPDLARASASDLIGFLTSPSATWRLHAQQEILRRNDQKQATALFKLITDKSLLKESRVAAIFTLAQLLGETSHKALLKASEDPAVREWCLRAMADRIPLNKSLSTTPFENALQDENPRVQVAAAVALGRIGNPAIAKALLDAANPPNQAPVSEAVPVGKPLFVSEKVEDKTLVRLDVDISQVKKLFLIVADGGNGTGADHGSFFEPYLIDKAGQKTKLTDLKWKSATAGWGKTMIDKDCTGAELKDRSGKLWSFGIGCHSEGVILYNLPKGKYVRFTSMAGNTSKGGGKLQFIVDSKKPAPAKGPEGPHATPNSDIVLPHIAIQALIALKASDACIAALGGENQAAAVWAMKYLHDTTMVSKLSEMLKTTERPAIRQAITSVLIRLYFTEKPYDGSKWWGTRPDTRGPYYYQALWDGSPMIETALTDYWNQRATDQEKAAMAAQLAHDRVALKDIDTSNLVAEVTEQEEAVNIDLEKIKNKKGQIGKMSVEDVMVALSKIKGDTSKGEALFNRQGCFACHSYKDGQPPKGPDMGAVGGVLSREEIIMSILRPNASISQGFQSYTISTKSGKDYAGFITKEQDGEVTLRMITGQVEKIKASDIKTRTSLPQSMMPPGLANGLSITELASLVDWLSSKK